MLGLPARLEPNQLDADERPRSFGRGAKQSARRHVVIEQSASRGQSEQIERTAPLVENRRLVTFFPVVRLVRIERTAKSRRPKRGLIEKSERTTNLPVDETRAPRPK